MVKAFVFDIGGVLINYDSEIYYQYLSEISGVAVKNKSMLWIIPVLAFRFLILGSLNAIAAAAIPKHLDS